MARLVVLYKKPKNAEAFDKHYSAVHIPLAKKIPGLKKYDISQGAVRSPAGPSEIHLVATLYFDSLEALKAGLASAEGKATAGDLANFADGGAELYFFDTKEV
ncbi:MAG TPA: EthD family reductase [Phyllobacterium sp.]|nr:EthD family reductase [Phyllobacterium sp.]